MTAPCSLRNIAIIAHVDHGKTTLVDRMLQHTGTFRAGQEPVERVMDSNPLERERGITIFSKNAAVRWRSPEGREHKINLVDTPGHADFGGEVERILRMVDGVLLLVDAFEGPMPQTRFVTRKALELGLQPIVLVNKADRASADPARVHDEVLELLLELEAGERQLDAPFLYASAREGWAVRRLEEIPRRARKGSGEPGGDAVGSGRGSGPTGPEADGAGSETAGRRLETGAPNLEPLFRAIAETIDPPRGSPDAPFRFLVSTLDHSPYLGRLVIGRIEDGRVARGDEVALWPLDAAEPAATLRVSKLFLFEGLGRREPPVAEAGEIVALAGAETAEIGDTLCDAGRPGRLDGIRVEPPTISVEFRPNDSPFAGRSGKYVTSRQLRERLLREAESNPALRVEETEDPDRFRISGRGELHLAILMEQMRREGYEFAVSRPRVITRRGGEGTLEEPFEEVVVDLPAGLEGTVIGKLAERRGELLEVRPGHGPQRLVRLRFLVPSRGLGGYRSEFLTDTRGEGTLHRQFHGYRPWAGELPGRRTGALVSMAEGRASAYSLFNLQERGRLFVGPGEAVYDGMVVGERARESDLEVNVTRGKKLTNVRAAGADENILLEPPREVTLEFALEFIREDELLEVTPEHVRLRKRALTPHGRKRERRATGEGSA